MIIVSPNRNKRSPNTVNEHKGRGGVGLGMTLGMKRLVRGGYGSMGMVCAQGASIFVPLSHHTRVTGGTGTSLFVSVRAGSVTHNEAMQKTRACALKLRHARRGLRITGGRGSIVLVRSGCRRHCTKFGPGSSRDCVVFRFMRSGGVRGDMGLTALVRGRFGGATGQVSGKMRRTKFLILHTASVPDILIRLNCVSAPSRRRCLLSSTNAATLSGDVCGTFLGCGHRRSTPVNHDEMRRRRLPRPRGGPGRSEVRVRATRPSATARPSGVAGGSIPTARGGVANSRTQASTGPMFGVRVLMSGGVLPGKDGRLGNMSPIDCCHRGKLCGCACKRGASCGGVLHVGHGVAPGFGSTFVVTFGGKRGVGIGRTVGRFGGGEWCGECG